MANLNRSSESFCVEEDKPDHHYRTEIPNIIFELELKPSTLITYLVLKRIAGDEGKSWASKSHLARKTGLSRKTINACLKELSEPNSSINNKPFIKIYKRKNADGSCDTDMIFIQNIWSENGKFFKKTNIPSQKSPPIKNEKKEGGGGRAKYDGG